MKDLKFEEMEEIQGGISKEEYCEQAWEIIYNNDIDPAIIGLIIVSGC